MSNVFEISNIQYKISIRVEKTLTVFVQGDFFNWASPENVSRLAPPKNALTGPPHFEKILSMAAERGEIPNTLTFLIPRGDQSGTFTFSHLLANT